MPKNGNDCGEKLVKQGSLVVGNKLGRRRRKVSSQVLLGLLSAGLYYVSLVGCASADRVGRSDARLQRAGNIAGLEEGRISLERLTKMMSTSVHVELAGCEDTFRQLLDHEWDLFSSHPDGTRSTFLVCSAPGRKNAKRLREIAGADSLVETLYYRKREPLCSVASLDQAAASLVASEGGGETFSVEPIPHLAKLATNVAPDPSPAALLLSSEALSGKGDEDSGGRRGRNLRDRRLREVAEQRARVLEEAAASTATTPTTQRLTDEGVRGFVDGIEIILTLHHERRSKHDTEELARRWLSEAKDQAYLAKVLRESHFWSKDQEQQQGEERGEAEQEAFSTSSVEDQRRREISEHAGRQRAGWASLLGVLEAGGGGFGRERGDSDADAAEGSGLGSCAFDLARFSVSPNGKKILIHKPHEIVAFAAQRGGDGAGLGEGCISALLAYISVQPEVHYVTARKKSVTMNLAAAWVTQSGVEEYTGLWDVDLQGQDEIIGVADTGVDLNHCHFREDDGDSIEASDYDEPVTDTGKRKVVQYISFVDDFDEVGGHGTHVAGTLAGAQSGTTAGDDECDGMAFQGKLAVFDFGDSDSNNALTTPNELGEIMFQPAYDAGARVHSNSWDTVSVEYTSISKEVDEFVYTHQDFLVVFAAGNCGDTSATDDLVDNCDTLDTDSGTVLSPALAKNVVAVGSSESGGYTYKDIGTVSYFSSKGYTNDGRIKPDVVAPGDPTRSSYADTSGETCEFGYQTGTSMATPVVAGNAAIARQYFREGWYNEGSKNLSAGYDPSAALIKAVLINSATPMEYAGVNPETSTLDVTLTDPPDEHQGHGRVTMVNALNINSTVGIFFKDWVDIESGETLEYEVSLYEDADTDKDLRITLVWTDPPAATSSTSALIHDLDLTVVAQSTGTVYYPNGGDEPDEVNNVEKIIITDTLQNETYTIKVSCDELSEAEVQSFALIANGEFIKTNDLPTAPDPESWLDLVDQAADTILTWRFGILIGFSVAACCVMICACRRCHRNRRQKLLESRYRQEITRNRSVLNGSKGQLEHQHRRGYRPRPYPGPVRAEGELKITDASMMVYSESWRKPGPGSVGGRSSRSGHSSRGGILTGSGAMIPPELLSRTTPSTPPQETCPECGLQLPGPVELVAHVETMHGGKATRRKLVDKASTGQDSKAMELLDDASTVVVSVSNESKTDSGEVPSARASGSSASVRGARTASAVLSAESALKAAAAAAAASGTRESYPRSNPKRSAISPTHKASVKPRPTSPDRFGSERHNIEAVSIRDDFSRVSEASKDIPSKAANSRLSTVKAERRQETTRAAAAVKATRDTRNGSTERRRNPPDVRSASSSVRGGGNGTSSSRDRSRVPVDAGEPSDEVDGRSRGQSRGRRPSNQGASLRLEAPKDVLRAEETRKLMRSKSLDRMSSLSSRAFVRSNGTVESNSSREVAENHGRRCSRRSESGMDAAPPSPEGRLSSGSLELYGSAYPTFSPVMSPTSRSKEPPYSPVARARAGELDEAQLPISRTRKFFRQLSGEL